MPGRDVVALIAELSAPAEAGAHAGVNRYLHDLWRRRPDLQADSAGTMAGRVVDEHLVVAKRDRRAVVVDVDRRLRSHLQPEHPSMLDDLFVEKEVVAVEIDRHVQRVLGCRHTRYVVHVRMRQQDVPNLDFRLERRRQART